MRTAVKVAVLVALSTSLVGIGGTIEVRIEDAVVRRGEPALSSLALYISGVLSAGKVRQMRATLTLYEADMGRFPRITASSGGPTSGGVYPYIFRLSANGKVEALADQLITYSDFLDTGEVDAGEGQGLMGLSLELGPDVRPGVVEVRITNLEVWDDSSPDPVRHSVVPITGFITVIPEPSTLAVVLLGGLLGVSRRRARPAGRRQ